VFHVDQASKPKRRASKLGLHRTGAYESSRFYTHRLSHLSRLLARTTKQMLTENFGLSQMEWRVLIQLEFRSPSKVGEIHERTLYQKAQISTALRSLMKRGAVAKEGDPFDRRAPFFAITEDGLELYRSVMRFSRRRQRDLEARLDIRLRHAFESAIDQLINSYSEEEAHDQVTYVTKAD